MVSVLERDLVMREELLDIFISVVSLLKMANFQNDFDAELAIEYKDYIGVVTNRIKQLQKKRCPIVIAGETSAGKSSLLNLIIGDEILPSGLLPCTSSFCQIFNSIKKKAVVIDENDEEIYLNDVTSTTLSEYIDCNERKQNYKRVDIYWPLPMLKDNAVLVDTPGVGERGDMTNKLMDFMQEAVAFIYVICTPDVGGVNEDRLGMILKKQAELEKYGLVNHFDPDCAIFVCNKWDQVSDREADRVWDNIAEKLKTMWPTMAGHDIRTQMYRMSVFTDVIRKQNGLECTDYFKSLMSGIDELISASLHRQIKQHARWLQMFMENIHGKVIAKKNMSNQSYKRKRDVQIEVERRLRFLENETENEQKKIVKEARDKCRELAIQILDHLRNEETQRRIFVWNEDVLPVGEYLSCIDEQAEPLILSKINNEVTRWCIENNVRCKLAPFFENFMQKIENQLNDINQIMQGIQSSSAAVCLPQISTLSSDFNGSFHFSEYIRHVPFRLGPFQIVLRLHSIDKMIPDLLKHLKKSYEERKKAKHKYINNKTTYMLDLAKERIELYNDEIIFECLYDTFLTSYESSLKDFCKSVIPKKIKSDSEMIQNIVDEQRDCETLIQEYTQIEKKCKDIKQNLLYFKIKYLSGCSPLILKEKDELGQGSYATVHLCEVEINGERFECAVKRHRIPKTTDSYTRLSEAETMRKFKHQNIIQCLGVSIEENASQKEFLNIFMEVCDCSLDVVILCDCLPMTICSCKRPRRKTCGMFRQEDRMDHGYQDTFEHFTNTLADILNGLIYLHENGFVHRDLKLSNILTKGGTAKIADIGLVKHIHHLQGTITGTPVYMAPEVLVGDMYGLPADIFSLAIMMWEMWHGRRVFSESEYSGVMTTYNSVKEHVLSGARPRFKASSAPPEEIQIMMIKCWNNGPKIRPTALHLKQILSDIVTAFRKIEKRERSQPSRHTTLYQR